MWVCDLCGKDKRMNVCSCIVQLLNDGGEKERERERERDGGGGGV